MVAANIKYIYPWLTSVTEFTYKNYLFYKTFLKYLKIAMPCTKCISFNFIKHIKRQQ